MKIIIAGAGDVGFHLAKLLAYESHDITLIDVDKERLKYAANHLDVATISGTSTSYRVLEKANVAKSDLLISATSIEETNLTTAIIAKQLGAKRTVARISNEEFLLSKEKLDLKKLGIDELISPESLAAQEIKRLLKEAALTDSFEFDKGLLSMIGISIEENSQLNEKTLKDTAYLNPDLNFITVAILRNNQTIIPHGETQFHVNDHAYFIAQPDGIDRVLDLSGKERTYIKNIMVIGGSKVGFHIARRLGKKYNIKVIEQNKEKAFQLADQLPEALVINGDCNDVELLKEEGITEMDAFIAVTGNSETNIISCLLRQKPRCTEDHFHGREYGLYPSFSKNWCGHNDQQEANRS